MANLKTRFIEPMLLKRTERLPDGPEWVYEIKLDEYRALDIKSDGRLQIRSRNSNDFTSRYRWIADALAGLPDETVVDGEFRERLERWLDLVRTLWPSCPAQLGSNGASVLIQPAMALTAKGP